MSLRIRGLVAAAHTPFTARGELNTAIIERQAESFARDGVVGAFVCGTTGECSSLTVDERIAVASRWMEVAQGFKVIVHVGANCLEDSKDLAAHAEKIGAAGVAAFAPSFLKPKDVATLADGLAMIAKACPRTPFYYYDIPSLTGVTFPAAEVLTAIAKQAPNLNGAKFTNIDLVSYQQCLHLADRKYDMPYGVDEALLAAVAHGAVGAVGMSYNFTAPLFNRVIAAAAKNDWDTARAQQYRGVSLLNYLSRTSLISAGKVIMEALGVDVGPARWPLPRFTPAEANAIREHWEQVKSGIR